MEIINISNKLRDFEEHLKLNRQTIVSAKFGDGKTYFLKQYIEQHKEDTFFIVLHPVNYVVSRNEDIFEYIKHDILSFLVKEPEYKEIDWQEALKGVINIESVLNGVEGLMDLLDPKAKLLLAPFKLFQKIDDRYAIDKYFDAFKNTQGGLFEFDDFSIAIKTTLSKIQEKGRKTVLIIEDLDRIDPEHLFRILNVLGAHVDDDKNTNKFGFDNIVAVLDYDTTEHIFHHFYGSQANYKGYMSKFMSSYPFRYSITQLGQQQLIQYLLGKGCSEELLSSLIIVGKDSNQLVSVLNVIGSLSIREVCNTLHDIEAQVGNRTHVQYQGVEIKTNAPIVYFLSVLVRLNVVISLSEMVAYLSKSTERMSILGGFLVASKLNRGGYVRIGDASYIISTTENGGVESPLFTMYWGTPANIEITELLRDTIRIIQENICDCSQVCRYE